MKKACIIFFFAVLCLGLTPGGMPSIYAQDDEFTLEEITVTAQKRAENQQKVSIAMEVFSGEDLQVLGKNDIDEILSTVSNVMINTSEDGLRVSVRGVSNDPAPFMGMQTSKPTVAVNKDGVYTNRNTGNSDLFDIERVEVLFGPQSTLYASASPGGIVNVITANPKLGVIGSSGSLEYGNYNQLKAEGAVNAPLGDMMAIRAAFSTSSHDGYLDNGGMDEDIKSGRVKFLLEPSDKLSILTTGEIGKTTGQGFSGVKNFYKQDDTTFVDGTPLNDPWTAADNFKTALAQSPMSNTDRRIFANIDYDFGYAGILSIISSYGKFSTYRAGPTSTGPPGGATIDVFQYTDGLSTEKSFEARVTSSSEFPFKWIIGLNLYKSDEKRHSWYFIDNDADPDFMDSNQIRSGETNTKSLYGNITYPLKDRFRLNLGVRKSWDENITGNMSWNKIENPTNPDIMTPSANDIMEYDGEDYKLGFEYDILDNSMLYADYSSGYRLNGKGGTRTGMDKVSPPERLKAYTVGAKNRFFANRVQLNVSAYYYDYKDYFTVGDVVWTVVDWNMNGIADPEEVDPATVTLEHDRGQLTTGDATVYGADVQSSIIFSEKDKLDISISYIKKKFEDMLFDYYDITNYLGLEDMRYDGLEMANAPHWTAKLDYRHNFHLQNGSVLTPRVEYTFQSSYLLTWQADLITLQTDGTGNYWYEKIPRDDVRVQEAYRLGNISITYADSSGKWTLNFYMNNVENYAVKRSLQGMGASELRIGPPRTYGAIFSVKY